MYLDHAATTPMRPKVWEAMEPFADDLFGNPSGVHKVSRRAKNALEEAREEAARMLGAQPLEIVFTGGGTESDNLAVKGAALAGAGGAVTTAIEHEAVLESAHFLERLGRPVAVVGVSTAGAVDVDEIASAVTASTALVSVMAANNETGFVLPVSEVARAVKARLASVAVHTDAVQAFSSHELNVSELGVDLLTLAGHKFGGPKGVGLLYVKAGTNLEPVLHGGGQELGRRSGTQNVMGAVGMVTAMKEATNDRVGFVDRVKRERDQFEETLISAGAIVTGANQPRLPQHAHLRLPGITNETLLVKLDGAGLNASAGSACQSGAVTISHVLEAMGWQDFEAAEAVRFTFGWTTEPGDGLRAAKVVTEAWR